MMCMVSVEQWVPARHPLRQLKPLVDRLLAELSPLFDDMYSEVGRPSVLSRSFSMLDGRPRSMEERPGTLATV